MTNNYGGLNNPPVISFSKRRGLSEEEFKEFLRLAREVANYNPQEKSWMLSLEKTRKKNKYELADILARLRDLSTLGEREISLVLSMLESFGEKVKISFSLRLIGLSIG